MINMENTTCTWKALIYINSWMLVGQKEIIQVNITLILYPPEIETPAESDGQRGASSSLFLGSLHLYNPFDSHPAKLFQLKRSF